MLDALRSGDFLNRERMRFVALALIAAYAAALAYLAISSHGLNDAQGRPLGTDFSNVYAAGTQVLAGMAPAPFDPALQYAREQAIFGAATPFYGWHYPPFFLFVAAALALLPYVPALIVWQVVTLALYLLAIRAILAAAPSLRRDPLWLLLALAFPAVFVNLGHGHNGFLTAALVGAGLALLDRRPIAAGILFGLLAYKPQFGILIPLVLVATGRWRTLAAAAATVMVLLLATVLAFGPRHGRHSSIPPGSRARSCSRPARPGGPRSRACSRWSGCGAARSGSPMRCRARSPSRSRRRWSRCGADLSISRCRRRH